MPNKDRRCLIIPGSPEGLSIEPVAALVGGICPDDYICCADGGYDRCEADGIRPDIVIGDFDSANLDAVRSKGIEVQISPSEKSDTDTLLCIKHGVSLGFGRFVIVGGIGGDFGHTLANIQTLSFLTDMECEAEIVTKTERLLMADGEAVRVGFDPKPATPAVFSGRPGLNFSVFSYTERSTGVYILNARYGLDDAILTQSYPIGARNEFINENDVTVSIKFGRLLIVAAI